MSGDDALTRRALLAAGAGAVGVLGGMATMAQARQVEFDHAQQVDSLQIESGSTLVVEWKEWYNGGVVATRDAGSGGPGQVKLPGISPGDSGTLTFGLSTTSDDGSTPPPVEVRMRVRASDRAENGITEPEREAGDTDAEGDLQEFVDVDLWYDTGVQLGGLPLYGNCDAEKNAGDTTIATGTLGEVATTADDQGGWELLDTDPGSPGGTCLDPDEQICLTLDWAVDLDEPDVNRIQGDSVEFAVEFQARSCSQ